MIKNIDTPALYLKKLEYFTEYEEIIPDPKFFFYGDYDVYHLKIVDQYIITVYIDGTETVYQIGDGFKQLLPSQTEEILKVVGRQIEGEAMSDKKSCMYCHKVLLSHVEKCPCGSIDFFSIESKEGTLDETPSNVYILLPTGVKDYIKKWMVSIFKPRVGSLTASGLPIMEDKT